MAFSEDKFRDHLKQVVKKTSYDSDRPLTLKELKELAESMGVSEKEWDEMMLKAETSLNQALGHLRVENYKDAIATAEEATSINPYIKDGNAILAQCYYKLSLADKNDDLLEQAAHYARMELQNDPMDSVALNVLSAVESIQNEGRFSKKLIRTVLFIVGAVLLIFVFLYMCRDSMQEKDVKDLVEQRFGETPDEQMTLLKSDVKRMEASYKDAIERRNADALELTGFIGDDDTKDDFLESITDYDMDNISKSEQTYRLQLSEVKREINMTDDMRIRLEGGDNRINTAKKRYSEAVATYNTNLESLRKELDGDFDQIEPIK